MLTATSHTKSQFTLGLTNIDISDVCSKPSDGTPLALGEIQSLEHVFHSLAARLLSHHLLLLPSLIKFSSSFHRALRFISLDLCTPVLTTSTAFLLFSSRQAPSSPSSCKTQFNWKPSATLP